MQWEHRVVAAIRGEQRAMPLYVVSLDFSARAHQTHRCCTAHVTNSQANMTYAAVLVPNAKPHISNVGNFFHTFLLFSCHAPSPRITIIPSLTLFLSLSHTLLLIPFNVLVAVCLFAACFTMLFSESVLAQTLYYGIWHRVTHATHSKCMRHFVSARLPP